MAKSRKTKPPFDRTPPGKPDDAAWVYRSEPPARVSEPPAQVIEPPAQVIDVVPVSTALSVPPRTMAPFERGIELISRPFAVVILLGMAALGALQNRRTLSLLLVCGTLTSVSCRSREIWAGQEFLSNGRLKLAAQDPYCGCLTIVSKIDKEVMLTGRFHGAQLGRATLKAGDSLAFRYDWAGPEDDDVYEIDAAEANGTAIDMQAAVDLGPGGCGTGELGPCHWMGCRSNELKQCSYGDLQLNLGGIGVCSGKEDEARCRAAGKKIGN